MHLFVFCIQMTQGPQQRQKIVLRIFALLGGMLIVGAAVLTVLLHSAQGQVAAPTRILSCFHSLNFNDD